MSHRLEVPRGAFYRPETLPELVCAAERAAISLRFGFFPPLPTGLFSCGAVRGVRHPPAPTTTTHPSLGVINHLYDIYTRRGGMLWGAGSESLL